MVEGEQAKVSDELTSGFDNIFNAAVLRQAHRNFTKQV